MSASTPSAPIGPRQHVLVRLLGAAALAAALALSAALAWRTLGSPDLGYHLAYGDHLLEGRGIVDSSAFIYTHTDRGALPPDLPKDLAAGPGCWYDDRGRYRFPNANYLSQALMAAVHGAGGTTGLCVLQLALVAGTFVLLAGLLLRRGVPPAWVAAGVTLAALVGWTRWKLRPELLGYLLLTADLLLLTRRRLGPGTAGALVGLQLLFVQTHVFWPMGVLLTACFALDAAARWLWARHRPAAPAPAVCGPLRRRLKWTSLALGGQIAVAFANPWTWRGAALPLQAALYLRRWGVQTGPASGHPWASIGELQPIFARYMPAPGADAYLLLALAAAGLLAAVFARRWALALVLIGAAGAFVAVSRNSALGALGVVPASLLALRAAADRLAARPALARAGWIVRLVLAGGMLAAAGWFLPRVVTGRFYYDRRRSWQFGAGLARLEVPADMAPLLRELPEGARLFTSFSISSNVAYFCGEPHRPRPVPVLTNTFAMPPVVMAENLKIVRGDMEAFDRFAARYRVGAVLADCTDLHAPFLRGLLVEDGWVLVRLGVRHALFLRRGMGGQALRITARGQMRLARSRHDRAAHALHQAALSAWHLAFNDVALALATEATQADDRYHEAWALQADCLRELALSDLQSALRDADPGRALDRVRAARRRLDRAAEIAPQAAAVQEARRALRMDLGEPAVTMGGIERIVQARSRISGKESVEPADIRAAVADLMAAGVTLKAVLRDHPQARLARAALDQARGALGVLTGGASGGRPPPGGP